MSLDILFAPLGGFRFAASCLIDVVVEGLHQRTLKRERSMMICGQSRMEGEMASSNDGHALCTSGFSRSPQLSAVALISFQEEQRDALMSRRASRLHQTGPRAHFITSQERQ